MKAGIFFILGLIALTDICDTISQLCLKASINTLDLHINTIKKMLGLAIHLLRVWRVWISFAFSTLSLVIWIFVLSRADLNLAFSLDSMRFILIAIASMIFLKEHISISRWAGITCVVGGIMLVAAG